jgi:hypothetical protein
VTAATPAVGAPARPAAWPQMAAGRDAKRGPGIELVAWTMYLVITAGLLAGAGGRLANYAYIGVSALAGLILYFRSPGGYVSFSLWLWFLTPFVRRVLDMHHGWLPANPALLAAPAVGLLSVLTILRRPSELRGNLYAPYLLVFFAFVYGYVVGIINNGFIPASYALLTYVAPAFFGLHLGLSWRRYPELAVSLRRTFFLALPLLAAYGIYQFVAMPRWDALWMINADMRSIGSPLPFLSRVFGTLNTPGPYAAVLCAGALMLLPQSGRLRFIPIGLAIVSLLLARTRAMWVAFLIGLLMQQFGQPLRKMPRYVITLVLVTLVALPIASLPKFSALIAPRLATFTNLSQDNSFIKRYNFSEQAAASIVETAEGNGLGATGGAVKLRAMQGVVSLDNGFLEIFYVFGWPGGMLFFVGLAGILLQTLRFRETRSDPMANSLRSIAVSLGAILPIGEVFTGATGTLIWMAVGMGIGGHGYHLVTGQALRSQAWLAAIRNAVGKGPTPPVPGSPAPAAAMALAPARSQRV